MTETNPPAPEPSSQTAPTPPPPAASGVPGSPLPGALVPSALLPGVLPDPPLLVRAGLTLLSANSLIRLRSNGTLGWDVRAGTLVIAGRIRLLPLERWRVVTFGLVVVVSLFAGGSLPGTWIRNWLQTTASAPSLLPAFSAAVGAVLTAVPCTLGALVVLGLNVDRVDLPAMALRGARVDGERLILRGSRNAAAETVIICLPDQLRQTEQLVDLVNRAATAIRDGLDTPGESGDGTR